MAALQGPVVASDLMLGSWGCGTVFLCGSFVYRVGKWGAYLLEKEWLFLLRKVWFLQIHHGRISCGPKNLHEVN